MGFNPDALCFGPQLAFLRDRNRFKVAVCGRRAGKTTGVAIALLQSALDHVGTDQLYVTLTRINAKQIIWPELARLNADYRLGGETNETELILKMPGGGRIFLAGVNNEREVGKIRGKKFKRAIIDEAQLLPTYLRSLIDDVIVPALTDYQGDLWLTGTPGPAMVGPFWDAWHGKAWSRHHWTMLDNPHIEKLSGKPVAAILAEERERRGIDENDPTYQREFLGQWVHDQRALVFEYNAAKQHYEDADLPGGAWSYVQASDLGFEDEDATAVLGWSDKAPSVYLLDEAVAAKQGLTELAETALALWKRYPNTVEFPWDFGGLGKKAGEEVIRRWGIPVKAAEKARKLEHIAILNDAMRTGRFKAKKTSRFAQDCMLVQWDMDAKARGIQRISDSYHTNIGDAVLYGFRACHHYLWEAESLAPTPEQKLDLWEQGELDRIEQRRSGEWWEGAGKELGYD